MRILICSCLVICSVMSYVADADKASGKSITSQQGFDEYVWFNPSFLYNYAPAPVTEIPKLRPSVDDMLTMYLALRYVWNVVLNPTTTTTTTTAATTTTTVSTTSTTTVATTTPPPTTTTIPVSLWTSVESCRYQLFSEKVTWNDADNRCKIYGATLAQVNMRDSTKRANVLAAISYTAGALVWVGVTDVDSADNTNAPTWLDTTLLADIPPGDNYKSLPGTNGCGYYGSAFTSPHFFKFTGCSDATLADIPDYYLCEICP